jgi:hypothetical protein
VGIIHTCELVPVTRVLLFVPGYRRVNGYTGTNLRRVGHHFFLEKTHYTGSRVSAVRRPYIIQILQKQQKKHKQQKKNPSTRTRARGTRVPETGTGMKRVGYGFEKKTRLTIVTILANYSRIIHFSPIAGCFTNNLSV